MSNPSSAWYPKNRCAFGRVVIAGNDPEAAVNAVSRSRYAYADIDRMMTSTNANIVTDLQQFPEKVGLLGTVLDARVIHLDVLTALAVARTYGDEQLKALMEAKGMSTRRDASAIVRIQESSLGKLLSGNSLGTGKRGQKPKENTVAAFANLASIATSNDTALNRAIGAALNDSKVISSFETEKLFGNDRKYYSDLLCTREGRESVRIEFMWRTTTGTADISNYALKKLELYGKSIGLFE